MTLENTVLQTRRRILRGLAGGVTVAAVADWFTVPGLFAQELTRTPAQTEGPFYPNKLPLDTDNDLLILNDAMTPAVGEMTHFSGRVLDAAGTRSAMRRRDLAGGPQRRLPARRDPNREKRDRELPGVRPVPDRIDRRVLLPHGQARAVSRAARRTSMSRSR